MKPRTCLVPTNVLKTLSALAPGIVVFMDIARVILSVSIMIILKLLVQLTSQRMQKDLENAMEIMNAKVSELVQRMVYVKEQVNALILAK